MRCRKGNYSFLVGGAYLFWAATRKSYCLLRWRVERYQLLQLSQEPCQERQATLKRDGRRVC